MKLKDSGKRKNMEQGTEVCIMINTDRYYIKMIDHVKFAAHFGVGLQQGSRATVRLGFLAAPYAHNDVSYQCLDYKQCEMLACQTARLRVRLSLLCIFVLNAV
jgi:hypothetical protein